MSTYTEPPSGRERAREAAGTYLKNPGKYKSYRDAMRSLGLSTTQESNFGNAIRELRAGLQAVQPPTDYSAPLKSQVSEAGVHDPAATVAAVAAAAATTAASAA